MPPLLLSLLVLALALACARVAKESYALLSKPYVPTLALGDDTVSWYMAPAFVGLGMFVAAAILKGLTYWQNNWKDKL